jgi:AcrR family transcriptional regulator
MRVFRGETGNLTELLGDLVVWIESYAAPSSHRRRSEAEWIELGKHLRPPPGAPPPDPPRRPLPRGRGALQSGEVAREHRDRILWAVAGMAKEKGYREMTVADITSAASVTRESFYSQFRGKEDAFLAVQTKTLQESAGYAAAEYFGGSSWPDQVWRAARVVLGYMSTHQGLAYAELIESYPAGPAAIRRSFDSKMAYTLFLENGYRQRPEAEGLPRFCSEAIGGAMLEFMRRHVAQGKGDRLIELLPRGVYTALAPFIGTAEAAEFVEAKVAVESD